MTSGIPSVSFEFFPPKTEKMEQSLWQAIQRLAPLSPSFVSVTYGAGGSTRERTHNTVTRIQKETGIPAAAHFTCVGATREEIDAIARTYWDAGIRHLVALRGDPPETEGGVGGRYVPHPGGYAYAADLVAGMKKVADFEISVAAYPEAHPEAPSAQFDLDNLKRKVDAGATRAITQFFFDNDAYFRFLDRCAAAGITVPIVPGILPITNFARAVEFAGKCGAAMPQRFAETFEGLDADPETRQLVAATMAAEQCQALQAQGIKEFHFYTLNRSDLTVAICRMLGVKAKQPAVS
ncbi:methylenetetrahydrofolate reductase [NAD(P)H] [Azospirillum formosense]|uniref:methylenetetrahydrofolate reductase [NAD(P)H] n=1 Tax=Azospirillum formosense TaxID=861533 RepID=UPI001C90DD78|nr:methylenetetrahydrofolate reductase [NAD(P)H] [Azospirillum formosense]MBY3753269.1 methylenetetrahydrofolate reductase [NAD(P)H] [Azospirillum formosense]